LIDNLQILIFKAFYILILIRQYFFSSKYWYLGIKQKNNVFTISVGFFND
jgi:hypothetical protein